MTIGGEGMIGNDVYIRMRQRVVAGEDQQLTVGDVAQLIADETLLNQLKNIPIHHISKQDHNRVVIDVMQVIRMISSHIPALTYQTIGAAQAVVEVEVKKKKITLIYILLIWFLLFVGAALAIMNFHEDVSMREVHGQIFRLITGNELARPLLLQIPYSIGLGLGMMLFFNHFFKKRLNEEPSPLEVEMFNYQQNLDQFVIMHELMESGKKENGH
ncbi:stage V sporulation protein AA [Alkalihalophilus lindianensis]|uniref:stage V sporulation protein AA n=1 Tax=Alkalihalophilus lindianensis TaxID=1630542 RepID=UPI003F6B87C8